MNTQARNNALKLATFTLIATGANVAHAGDFDVLYSDQPDIGKSIASGMAQRQLRGVTQVQLGEGNRASIVGAARYTVNDDGSLDLLEGSATVSTGQGRLVVVRLPNGVIGTVPRGSNAARFSAMDDGTQMNVMTGRALLEAAGKAMELGVGGFAATRGTEAPERVIAGDVQVAPGDMLAGLPQMASFNDMQSAMLQSNTLTTLQSWGALQGFGEFNFSQMWALALAALYEYIRGGHLPSEYAGGLTREQILAALDTLESNGDMNAFLDQDAAAFWSAYHAWLADGGALDGFPGLKDDGVVVVDPPPPPPPAGGGDTPVPPAPPPVTGSKLVNGVYVVAALNRPGDINGGVMMSSNGAMNLNVRNIDDTPTATNSMISTGDLVIPATAARNESWSDGKGMFVGRLSTEKDVGSKISMRSSSAGLTQNQGFHYAYLNALSGALPTTGQVQYKLGFATKPTWDSGDLMGGTFLADMVIAFQAGGQRVGLVGSLDMPGDTKYTFSTAGGLAGTATAAPVVASADKFSIPLMGTGRACPASASNCNINVNFMTGGENAGQVGVAYNTTGYSAYEHISGAAGFVANGAYVPSGGTPTGSPFANKTIYGVMLSGHRTFEGNNTGLHSNVLNEHVTFDDKGAIINAYSMSLGSATVSDYGSIDGALVWSRWTNPGMKDSTGATITTLDRVTKANDAWQYFMGAAIPFSAPASGSATYTVVGGTPTHSRDDAVSGSISGKASMNFGTSPMIGFDLSANTSKGVFKVMTPGGTVAPSMPVNPFGMFQAFDYFASHTTLCGTGKCQANIQGAVAGAGGTHVGLILSVYVPNMPTSNFQGMAVLVKDGATYAISQADTVPPSMATGNVQATASSAALPALAQPAAQGDWDRWVGQVSTSGVANGLPVETAARVEGVDEQNDTARARAEARLQQLFGNTISFNP